MNVVEISFMDLVQALSNKSKSFSDTMSRQQLKGQMPLQRSSILRLYDKLEIETDPV